MDEAYRQFLFRESALLDRHAFEAWFDLLDQDIGYQIPVRTTRERAAATQFSDSTFHMDEDHGSIRARIDKYLTEYDWTEDPPSRVRHFITNIRPTEKSETEVVLRDNLLYYRSQGDTSSYDLLSGERESVIRKDGSAWRLAQRVVRLDHTVLDTDHLTFL